MADDRRAPEVPDLRPPRRPAHGHRSALDAGRPRRGRDGALLGVLRDHVDRLRPAGQRRREPAGWGGRMTPQPTESGPAPVTLVRCAVCGRWKPEGGRWLTALDPGS